MVAITTLHLLFEIGVATQWMNSWCWSRGSCTIRTNEDESPPQQNTHSKDESANCDSKLQRWKELLNLMDELEHQITTPNPITPTINGTVELELLDLSNELGGWTWWGMEQLEHCVGLTNLSQGNQTHWCELLVQQTEWRESLDRVLFVLIEF